MHCRLEGQWSGGGERPLPLIFQATLAQKSAGGAGSSPICPKSSRALFCFGRNANRTPPPCTLIANQGFLRIQEDLTEDLCKDVTEDFLQRCE